MFKYQTCVASYKNVQRVWKGIRRLYTNHKFSIQFLLDALYIIKINQQGNQTRPPVQPQPQSQAEQQPKQLPQQQIDNNQNNNTYNNYNHKNHNHKPNKSWCNRWIFNFTKLVKSNFI